MIKKLAVVTVAAVFLMPLLASARHVDVRDGNDTRGLLDMKKVEMTKSKPPKWKVRTWRSWSVEKMWDRGFILVYLDTFGNEAADYYALVASDGRRLVGSLYRDRAKKSDFRIRSLRARHPRGRVATVAIPMNKLRRRNSKLYRWYALTMFSGSRCKQVCFDRAPNNGWVNEPAPVPDPEPEPVPTETPTIPPPTPTPSP